MCISVDTCLVLWFVVLIIYVWFTLLWLGWLLCWLLFAFSCYLCLCYLGCLTGVDFGIYCVYIILVTVDFNSSGLYYFGLLLIVFRLDNCCCDVTVIDWFVVF